MIVQDIQGGIEQQVCDLHDQEEGRCNPEVVRFVFVTSFKGIHEGVQCQSSKVKTLLETATRIETEQK